MNRDTMVDIGIDVFYYPMKKVFQLLTSGVVMLLKCLLYVCVVIVFSVVWITIFALLCAWYWVFLFVIATIIVDFVDGPYYDGFLIVISALLSLFAAFHAIKLIHARAPKRPYQLYINIVDEASRLRPTSRSSKRAYIHSRRNRK